MTSPPTDHDAVHAAASTAPTDGRPLHEAAAWAALPDRTLLTATGRDAVRFLDGFTTAAVSRIAVGGGSEGFITDARGWVIALVDLLRDAEGVRIGAGGGLGQLLLEHLEHYHIREALTLADGTPARTNLVVAGRDAAAWFPAHLGMSPPDRPLDHLTVDLGGHAALAIRTDWYGLPAFRLDVERRSADAVAAWLASTGLPQVAPAALDAARIEAGSPEPHDIPARTLPQELARDARAISFTKGCYLGQETVARIDALGHVNRRFVALTGAGVAPGAAITLGDDPVGTVTSACHSPRLGRTLGLALVHVRGLAPDVALHVGGAPGRVVPFPALASGGFDT